MPGRLVFKTTSASASSPTERMRINSGKTIWLDGSDHKYDTTDYNEIQYKSYFTTGQYASGTSHGYIGWNITGGTSGNYKARVTGDKASVLQLHSDGSFRFSNTGTTNQTADSALSGLSERMRILATGGISFNGDTDTANALDDYEEGVWTPAAFNNNNGASTNSTSNSCLLYTSDAADE